MEHGTLTQKHYLKKIDKAANMWNKTKDPKYKELWYKLLHGYYSSQRRTLPSDTNNKRHIGRTGIDN